MYIHMYIIVYIDMIDMSKYIGIHIYIYKGVYIYKGIYIVYICI